MKNGKLNGKVAVVTGASKESAQGLQNNSQPKVRLWSLIMRLPSKTQIA